MTGWGMARVRALAERAECFRSNRAVAPRLDFLPLRSNRNLDLFDLANLPEEEPEELPPGFDWALSVKRPTTTFELVLVGCSATKGGPGPARAFYRGQDFRLCLQLGELVGRWVAILSARHGLVMPHQQLEPYNLALSSLPKAQREAWKQARGEELAWFQGKRVLCLAPGAYWKGIPGSEAWRTPLAGLGQGRRKAELAAMLARVKEGRAP